MQVIKKMSENRSIIPRPTCSAIIVKDGKVLLQKRSDKVSTFSGYWATPGGRIDYGETAEEAVKREVKEEMGVDFKIDHFQGYYDEIFPDVHYVVLVFVGTISGDIRTNEEVTEWAWVPIEEALKRDLAFKQNKRLQDYYERNKE